MKVWNNKFLFFDIEKFNSTSPQSVLKLTDDLLDCFNEEKNKFVAKVELFDCGNDNYENSPEILKKLKEIKVHRPDYIIIIDANDYSLDNPITFLTCDDKLYLKIVNAKFLNIQNYELIKLAN